MKSFYHHAGFQEFGPKHSYKTIIPLFGKAWLHDKLDLLQLIAARHVGYCNIATGMHLLIMSAEVQVASTCCRPLLLCMQLWYAS